MTLVHSSPMEDLTSTRVSSFHGRSVKTRTPLALTFSVEAHAGATGSSPFESRTRNFLGPPLFSSTVHVGGLLLRAATVYAASQQAGWVNSSASKESRRPTGETHPHG